MKISYIPFVFSSFTPHFLSYPHNFPFFHTSLGRHTHFPIILQPFFYISLPFPFSLSTIPFFSITYPYSSLPSLAFLHFSNHFYIFLLTFPPNISPRFQFLNLRPRDFLVRVDVSFPSLVVSLLAYFRGENVIITGEWYPRPFANRKINGFCYRRVL